MIDYIALALGHGLMAIALLRLVLRADCDADPLLGQIKADTEANRKAAKRRARDQRGDRAALAHDAEPGR